MNYLSSVSLDIRQEGVQRGWMEYTEVLVAPANPKFDNVHIFLDLSRKALNPNEFLFDARLKPVSQRHRS